MTESNEISSTPAPPWWRHYVREHPALILSGSYLFLTLIGAIYNGLLCRRFGINILDLADGADFLMFAVRDLVVVVQALFAIFLFVGTHFGLKMLANRLKSAPKENPKALTRFLERRFKDYSPRQTAIMCIIFAIFWTFYYLNQYASANAGGIKAGKGQACEYAMADEPKAQLQPAQLVTTTSRFVVLYRLDDKTTQVIPLESLSRLVFTKK